jgi:photosystem II stability/assembly factor-like uncharacterized protein
VVVRLVQLAAAFALVLSGVPPAGAADNFQDPLDSPAVAASQGANAPLISVARAGNRLVAVGLRGLVVTSDNGGETWQQAAVPVSSGLLSVRFVTPELGWISGHDGVVLHSMDGGRHWSKQLDGREAAKLLISHFEERAAAGLAEAGIYLEQAKIDFANGPEQPFLDIWFEDARNGFVCGPFGLLLATHDGGASWESWMENIDNPNFYHLFALAGIGGKLFITGEKGTVFRLDRDRQRFVAQHSGYQGSFFGALGTQNYLIAYGLRGNAYRSADAGRSWTELQTGLRSSLNGGTILEDGRIVLVSQGGDLIVSADEGNHFRLVAGLRPSAFAGVAQIGRDAAAVVGLNGLQQVTLK